MVRYALCQLVADEITAPSAEGRTLLPLIMAPHASLYKKNCDIKWSCICYTTYLYKQQLGARSSDGGVEDLEVHL